MDSSYIFKGPIDNLKLKGVSFAELLYDSLRKKEQSNILLVDENTDEGIYRGDLLQNSIKLAVILQQMGICENDRVGIISANTWKFVVPTLSAIFIGATVTPINPAATKDDLRHYLTLSKPKILFVSSDVLEKVRELKNDLSFLKHIIVLDAEDVENDELVFNELFNRDVNYKTFQIHKDNSAEALILYSSGTTGFPKGVVLSQENVLNAMEYCSDPDYLNINEDSIILGILPLFHVFGLLLMYAYLWLGKRIIFSRKFKPDTFLKSIEKYEISYLVTVPPLLLFLAKSPLVDNYDIRSIKHIFCGAAPLGKEVENIASQRFKIPICQLYGMSECAAITITSPKYYKSGSVGKVVPGHEAKIIDPESGNILPPTVSGEICFKGPTVMKGYIDNEKATRETIDKDGYLHTGDIGYFDEEGYLFILDRIKDLIKYKGFQIDVFTGRTISYKSLLQISCELAEALRSRGYEMNTVMSVCSENNLEFYIPVLAALFVGCIMFPVNHNYTENEMKLILNIGKPKVIFCSKNVSFKLLHLKKLLGFLEDIVIIDSNESVLGTESLKLFVKRSLRGKTVSPQKFQPIIGDAAKLGAFILCSSGTTGLPKGVLISHRSILTRLLQSRDPRYSLSSKNILGLMPFFHSYGLNVGLDAIANGNKLVVLKRFDEDVFLKSIQDYEITMLALAPPLAVFMEKSPKILNYDLSCVEEVACGAAPLSKNTELALRKRLKNLKSFRQGYGLTEATFAVTIADKENQKPGSCGKVGTFMTCKVRDPETGKSLGPNQTGELCCKGPFIMMGYYNDEKATRETFTSDGWLKTGDLGYYDEEGNFYIVDRLKELIKYKGYQVAPAELEALLLNHPKVRDVGVVGLPDELSGELPLAFVVKKEGLDVTEDELQKYVSNMVSSQKRLRGGVIFVSEIPKNPSGKILRRELKERLKNYQKTTKSKL